MKSKKEKLKITALAAAATILLTGAGTEQNNKTNSDIENTSVISIDTKLNTSNIIRNDILLIRINNYILTQMNGINDEDKIKQIIESLKKIIDENKIEITSITYKYNNNGTHTITTKYINKLIGKEETKITTSKCTYKNNSNKCQECGHIKRYSNSSSSSSNNTHSHNFIEISEEIISNENGTHTIIVTFECPSDGVRRTNTEIENCTLTDWEISEDKQTEKRECLECDYLETKPHIEEEHVHSNPPENLEYKLDTSNNDNTHNLKGYYTCDTCNEEIEISKTESCSYTTTGYEIFSIYNSYNEHDRIDTCDVCGYENKVREACTKTGEQKYIKINSNIYEYYECEDCKGYVDRTEHINHTFGEWEIDPDRHIRYCGCVEAREEGEHIFSYTPDPDNEFNNLAICNTCGYTKNVLNHEHLKHEMDLMDLISTYEYQCGAVSKSQYKNPNPSYDVYCSAYEVICPTCKSKYLIEYKHKFVNGVCTRVGYCGGIQDPNYIPSNPIDDEAQLDILNYKHQKINSRNEKIINMLENSNKLKLIKK